MISGDDEEGYQPGRVLLRTEARYKNHTWYPLVLEFLVMVVWLKLGLRLALSLDTVLF